MELCDQSLEDIFSDMRKAQLSNMVNFVIKCEIFYQVLRAID